MPSWDMALHQAFILLSTDFSDDGYVMNVSACPYSVHPSLRAHVWLNVWHNSAVTSWLSGPHMVNCCRGIASSPRFYKASFHCSGMFKVKLRNSLCPQKNSKVFFTCCLYVFSNFATLSSTFICIVGTQPPCIKEKHLCLGKMYSGMFFSLLHMCCNPQAEGKYNTI